MNHSFCMILSFFFHIIRQLDEESLGATLESDKLCSSDIEQVVQLVSKGRCSEACRAHYKARVGMVVQSYDEEKHNDEVYDFIFVFTLLYF